MYSIPPNSPLSSGLGEGVPLVSAGVPASSEGSASQTARAEGRFQFSGNSSARKWLANAWQQIRKQACRLFRALSYCSPKKSRQDNETETLVSPASEPDRDGLGAEDGRNEVEGGTVAEPDFREDVNSPRQNAPSIRLLDVDKVTPETVANPSGGVSQSKDAEKIEESQINSRMEDISASIKNGLSLKECCLHFRSAKNPILDWEDGSGKGVLAFHWDRDGQMWFDDFPCLLAECLSAKKPSDKDWKTLGSRFSEVKADSAFFQAKAVALCEKLEMGGNSPRTKPLTPDEKKHLSAFLSTAPREFSLSFSEKFAKNHSHDLVDIMRCNKESELLVMAQAKNMNERFVECLRNDFRRKDGWGRRLGEILWDGNEKTPPKVNLDSVAVGGINLLKDDRFSLEQWKSLCEAFMPPDARKDAGFDALEAAFDEQWEEASKCSPVPSKETEEKYKHIVSVVKAYRETL